MYDKLVKKLRNKKYKDENKRLDPTCPSCGSTDVDCHNSDGGYDHEE